MTAGSARTLVLQSHRKPLPFPWLRACLDSVRAWASARRFDYRFLDDALFAHLPQDLRERYRAQPVVSSDLARLLALRAHLREKDAKWDTVVWIDADVLIFDPERLRLPRTPHAVGREVWVQNRDDRLKVYTKVHNAFLMFRAEDALLEFYVQTAARMLRAHEGPVVPQFVGPKLLTALHNVAGLHVLEEAGMLSPLVAQDIARGEGPALRRFVQKSPVPPAALNLCGSLSSTANGSAEAMEWVIGVLRKDHRRLLGSP